MINIQFVVVLLVSSLISLEANKRVPVVINNNSSSSKSNKSSNNPNAAYKVDGTRGQGMDPTFLLGIFKKTRMMLANQDIRNFLPRPIEMNEICYNGIIDFLDALIGQSNSSSPNDLTTTAWALRMFDAYGKPGSGLLEGRIQWVGTYQECLGVHADIPAGTKLGSRVRNNSSSFDARYCRVEVVLDRSLWEYAGRGTNMNKFWYSEESPDLVLNWGVCVPDSCKGPDIQALLTKGALSSFNLQVQEAVCYDDTHIERDATAMFAIVLLALYGTIVMMCTALESYWHYTRRDNTLRVREQDNNNGGKLVGHDNKESHRTLQTLNCGLSNGSADPKTDSGIKQSGPGSTDFTIDIMAPTAGNGTAKLNGTANCKDPHSPKRNPLDTPPTTETAPANCQINPVYDEMLEGENCRLESEKELPDVEHCENPDGKDVKETCLQKAEGPVRNGVGTLLVKAFSLRENLTRLLKTSRTPRPGVIQCINGIRVISMLWIVLGHTYTFGAIMDGGNIMFDNSLDVTKMTARISFFLVPGATFAVDSFFLISGLLVTMLTLKDLQKRQPTVRYWGLFYFHRLWRLTPVYMVVMMFGITMYDHTAQGPLKSQPLAEFDDCHSKWWSHLLYINNLYHPRQKCMTWTWYLAVDMQLFALAPIIIYVIHRSYRLGMSTLIALVVTGMVSAFICQYYHHGQFVLMDQVFTDYWQHVYIVPWTRLGAFTIGMFLGVILLDDDQTPRMSKPKAFCIWVLAAIVVIFIILIPHNQWKEGSNHWSNSVQGMYEALSRPMWSICVAWVIFACHTKMGGVANNILSWPGFQVASRITYAVYLIHPIVMTFFLYSRHSPVLLHDGIIIYQYIGNVVLSYVFGTLLCIVFESPIQSLEKILLNPRTRRRTENKR